MDRDSLIKEALRFQEKVNELIMEYSFENWLLLHLSIGQLKSLIYIQHKGRTNSKGLARVLGVTPSVITGIIDRLVLQGMVNRTSSTKDRRVQWLTVTDRGKSLLDNIRQKNIEDIHNILKALSNEELTALVQGFSALTKAAEAYIESRNGVIGNTGYPEKIINYGRKVAMT